MYYTVYKFENTVALHKEANDLFYELDKHYVPFKDEYYYITRCEEDAMLIYNKLMKEVI